MTAQPCWFCDEIKPEMRPYGPGGHNLCFACLKATPEREAAARRAFGVQLEVAEVAGQGVSVLTERGAEPSTEHEREMLEREWLR
jgi:hypothetical protein